MLEDNDIWEQALARQALWRFGAYASPWRSLVLTSQGNCRMT